MSCGGDGSKAVPGGDLERPEAAEEERSSPGDWLMYFTAGAPRIHGVPASEWRTSGKIVFWGLRACARAERLIKIKTQS